MPLNARSSRSHSLFTLYVETTTKVELEGGGGTRETTRFSKFQFVDLAGSERIKSSHAQGDQLKDAQTINKSLFALANVIQACADRKPGKHVHIPYRNAKVGTRLTCVH